MVRVIPPQAALPRPKPQASRKPTQPDDAVDAAGFLALARERHTAFGNFIYPEAALLEALETAFAKRRADERRKALMEAAEIARADGWETVATSIEERANAD